MALLVGCGSSGGGTGQGAKGGQGGAAGTTGLAGSTGGGAGGNAGAAGGTAGSVGGAGAMSTGTAGTNMSDAGGDDAGDAADEGGLPPGVCTETQHCDPIVEVCIEDTSQPTPTGAGPACGTYWQCYTHRPPPHGAHDVPPPPHHPCPTTTTDFCGCDGVTFQRGWYCADRPYDHIGACGDGYSCDAQRVQCADPEPTCPDGQVAAVVNNCWGPCIPFSDCRCEFVWQCRPSSKYTCNSYPVFRCAEVGSLDGGNDGGNDGASDDGGGLDAADAATDVPVGTDGSSD